MSQSRNSPVIITERTARFTAASHNEIEISYPFDGLPDDVRNGEKQTTFYDATLYASRQAEHGKAIYPDPTPFTDGHFKR